MNIAVDIAKMASFLHSSANPKRAQRALIAEGKEGRWKWKGKGVKGRNRREK
jgi:hypothetical protein